jgi:hypothetical protein
VIQEQGDQISLIFAYGPVIRVGQFLRKFQKFLQGKSNALIFTKKMFRATVWAIFPTNSSGHPGLVASTVTRCVCEKSAKNVA